MEAQLQPRGAIETRCTGNVAQWNTSVRNRGHDNLYCTQYDTNDREPDDDR